MMIDNNVKMDLKLFRVFLYICNMLFFSKKGDHGLDSTSVDTYTFYCTVSEFRIYSSFNMLMVTQLISNAR
jgi:hypothetical protein